MLRINFIKEKKNLLKKILFIIDKKDKKIIPILYLLMILAAILEFASLGLLVPLLEVITNQDNPEFIKKINFFDNLETKQIIIYLVVIFALIYSLKTFLLLFMNWLHITFFERVGSSLAIRLYSKYLNQKYMKYIERNSSEFIRNIREHVVEFSYHGIYSILSFSTDLFILCSITGFLFYYQMEVTIYVTLFIVIIFFFFI